MITLTIPSFRQIVPEDERSYTTYQIHVKVAGRTRTVEKRYREFHSFHKKLKKCMDIPDLPSKKVLQLSAKGLEHRRQGLENYLKGIVESGTIPKSLLMFLKVKNFNVPVNYDTSTHQPMLVYENDPFLHPLGDNTDVLVDGVLQGLYDKIHIYPESSSSSS